MSSEQDKAPQDTQTEPDIVSDEGGEAEQGADTAPADGDALQAQLDEAHAEIEQLRDAALRAQAEMENVRRRSARDVENAHKFALERFAGQLLPVADSMEKSVEAAHEATEQADGLTGLLEGIELSQRLLLDTLSKAGVEAIDPLGEPFDPERHEAMSMVPAPDAEPNAVVNVLQKGYTLNGRLLRAAMVIVAKAPEESAGG